MENGPREMPAPGLKWSFFDWLAACSFQFPLSFVIVTSSLNNSFYPANAQLGLQIPFTHLHTFISTPTTQLTMAKGAEGFSDGTCLHFCFPLDPSCRAHFETPLPTGLYGGPQGGFDGLSVLRLASQVSSLFELSSTKDGEVKCHLCRVQHVQSVWRRLTMMPLEPQA